MPYSQVFLARFSFRSKLSYPLIIVITMFATVAHGAEWRECEKAKTRELKMHNAGDERKTSKRKNHRRKDDSHQSAEQIDTWLWKNCREFSYELHQLEQEKM